MDFRFTEGENTSGDHEHSYKIIQKVKTIDADVNSTNKLVALPRRPNGAV